MDSLWTLKIISIFLIGLITVLGAYAGLRIFGNYDSKESLLLHATICFTSSVFITVALVHLLSDAVDSFSDETVFGSNSYHSQYLVIFAVATSGVIVAELIEYASIQYTGESGHGHGHGHGHSHGKSNGNTTVGRSTDQVVEGTHDTEMGRIGDEKGDKNEEEQDTPFVLVILFSFHSFVAGVALGASTSHRAVIILLIAIVAHKWAEALAICYELVGQKEASSTALKALAGYSIMTPLGIIIASLSTGFLSEGVANTVQALITAFTSGVFLYAGLSHLEASRQYQGPHKFTSKAVAQISAFILLVIVAIWD